MQKISIDEFVFNPEEDDFVIPFGVVRNNEDVNVSYNQAFETSVKPLLQIDDFFSQEGINTIISAFEKDAEKLDMLEGIEQTEVYEANDSKQIDKSVILSSSEIILLDSGYENLTDIEPDDDSVCVGTVIDGKIVSMACENPHDEDDLVIDIAVETNENYRNMGYAASNVAKLAYYILDPGKKVTYICEKTNVSSSSVAKKAGLTFACDELRVILYKE